jgi:octaprenyl-diphosphate synthase
MSQHRDRDRCAGNQGSAHLDLGAVTDSQDLVKHDLLAHIRSNLFYFNFFASSNTILFATGFYDRVHMNLLNEFHEWKPGGRNSAEPASVACTGKADKSGMGRGTGQGRTRQRAHLLAFHTLPIIVPLCKRRTNTTILTTPSAQAISPLDLIQSDMLQVDQVISERLTTEVPLVKEVAQYIISAGGKRLRPALLLLMSGAIENQNPKRHTLAAVVEFIHTATLLHDDVVDESTLRRGRPTANERFGNAASVLVGDFLYSRAFQMMVDINDMRVMQVLSDATNVIAEGEVLQLMNMHDASIDEAGYLRVIRSKTAKLFEASARLAPILAAADAQTEALCAQYGQALGTAFQVVDDVLDYEGSADELGKNLGDDLREGKVTLPIICALRSGSDSQKALIRQAIELGDLAHLNTIRDIIMQTGALEAARSCAHAEAQRAIDAARRLPANAYSGALLQLAAGLLERRS